MTTRIGSTVTLADGSKGIRVDGLAAIGDRVSTPRGTSSAPVTRVIWSGVARDGRQASMVEIGEMVAIRANRYAPGAAGSDAYDNH